MDEDEDNDLPLNERIDLINRNNPSVTKFELEYHEGQRMTEDQIRAHFRGLRQNTHVRKLDLRNTPNRLRPTVCQQLLPPLLQENSSIEDLRFPVGMTIAEFESTKEVLRNNNATVKTLRLAWCDIRGGEGGEIIARLIRNNHHITTINLNGNTNLGPHGGMRIAAALGSDDCALKTLDLSRCGIGDEGVAALCTALQVNNSLEMFLFDRNQITDEGYRVLAGSLPGMSGLKEIYFVWEQHQVSAAVLQQIMDGLRKNQSLQRIAVDADNLSEEQRREWRTCCAFVGARNKMESHLDQVRDAARDGRVAQVQIQVCSLLWWCRHHEDAEVQDSLVFHVLRSNADEILGLADAAAEDAYVEKKAATTTARTGRYAGRPQDEQGGFCKCM